MSFLIQIAKLEFKLLGGEIATQTKHKLEKVIFTGFIWFISRYRKSHKNDFSVN